MSYVPHYSIVEVKLDGATLVVDADIKTPRTCLVYGIQLGGVWMYADYALSSDFTKDIEAAINDMPLNAEGDIDDAAIRYGEAVMARRAAEGQA